MKLIKKKFDKFVYQNEFDKTKTNIDFKGKCSRVTKNFQPRKFSHMHTETLSPMSVKYDSKQAIVGLSGGLFQVTEHTNIRIPSVFYLCFLQAVINASPKIHS